MSCASQGHNRRGLPDKDQEGRLECVLGIRLVPQDTFADAEHHGSVAVHEHFERGLVAAGDKSIQQFAIPDWRSVAPAGHLVEMADDTFELSGRHAVVTLQQQAQD